MHHPFETAVAVAAALVALAFGLSTFERWRARRQPHELAWSVALAMFSLAAAALAGGAQAGWSTGLFRLFYLFGAIVNVPFLALGTVYLLAGRRVGDRVAAAIALASAFAAGVLVTAPFRAALPSDQLAQGSQVFGAWPRILAGVASAGGAVVIFGGAAWSAWRVWRNHAPRRLLASNALIAIGTLILASSGTLNSVFGAMTAFAVTLLAGIVVLFCGFLLAGTPRRADRPSIAPAQPWRTPGPVRPLPVEEGEHAGAASRPSHAAVTAKR
jgi:MFS family permease